MTNELKDSMRAEFIREDRYIVIKRSDMRNSDIQAGVGFSGEMPKTFETDFEKHLASVANGFRAKKGKPPLECLVIESDWPEYEIVWQMIEARMTGKAHALMTQPVEHSGVPDGYALVPIEPTKEMIDAFFHKMDDQGYSASKNDLTVNESAEIYKAMVSAAIAAKDGA